MKPFKQLLIELSACEDAREFAADKPIEEVVSSCHRGDWLLWLAKKVGVDFRKLTLAKGHCANTVRNLMKDERSTKAVDAAIDFGNGLISKDELKAAASSASAAYAAYAAYAASSAYAAYAAYAASDYAAYAAYAASAYASASAAYAAYAAASYAAYAASDYASASAAYAASDYAADRKQNQLLTADICRKYISAEIVTKVNELLN